MRLQPRRTRPRICPRQNPAALLFASTRRRRAQQRAGFEFRIGNHAAASRGLCPPKPRKRRTRESDFHRRERRHLAEGRDRHTRPFTYEALLKKWNGWTRIRTESV